MFEPSIIFALASLVFGGINDFVFKMQANGSGRCGQYLAVVGVVWMTAFSIPGLIHGVPHISIVAIKWGIIIGFLAVVANYLLIWSLRSLDAGVGVTIYRLNLLAATIIAIIFLGESLTATKTFGVIAACVAVLLFSYHKSEHSSSGMRWAMIVVFLASLMRACVGIGYKLNSRELNALPAAQSAGQAEWFLAVQGVVWLLVGLIIMRLEGESQLDHKSLNYGVLSGLLICGLVWFFNRAMAIGDASVVIPISQMSFLATALLSWGFIKEKFTGLKPFALAASVAAIFLLSRS